MPKFSINDLNKRVTRVDKKANIFGAIAIVSLAASLAVAFGVLPL
tara:strand:+ start:843 stop:977 length:135 start_codon:yes stop_codon:yes gene_type:complete